ncbi:MAG: integrase/recombinase XerD [Acidobacteriota bacterium]|nr:integrase/recombinase XerD [Acidobacteriota bacterium]
MRDLVKDYIGYLQVEKGLSVNTVNSYLRDLKSLDKYALGVGKELGWLTKDDLLGWIKKLTLEGAATSSMARRISSVKGFYRYLLREGLGKTYPHADLISHTVERKLPAFLEGNEVDALISIPNLKTHMGRRDRAIIELLYATGIRVSELVNLRVHDVSMERALLLCQGKGSKQRYIPLGRSVLISLREYLNVRHILLEEKDSDVLFIRKKGERISRQYIWSSLRRYAERAGLGRVSPHSLRHTFASHLIQRGADSRAVQALLGHSDLATTQIYTHISNEHLTKTLEQFHPRMKVEKRK